MDSTKTRREREHEMLAGVYGLLVLFFVLAPIAAIGCLLFGKFILSICIFAVWGIVALLAVAAGIWGRYA